MQRIGILYHPLNESAYKLGQEVENILKSKGVNPWICSAWEEDTARQLLDGTDLILSIGGDGTILRAAQIAFKKNIPITGINMGTLGFMTELNKDDVPQKLDDLIGGKGWIDERCMLEVEVSRHAGTYYALNDVVLARGSVARMVSIDVRIDDEPFTVYRADGVILSTATGSTGYNLAAGGPVVHFNSPDIIITPIVPHLGLSYSLILSSDNIISLRISTGFPATLSVDGHINLVVSDGTEFRVKHSSFVTRFLRIQQKNSFYRTLEHKLKGK